MQKRILSGIVLWMALWAALIGCATAEDENRHILDISLVVNPTEMVEPQEVSLTFTITNNSSESAENVYISSFDGLLSEPIGLIAPGETQTVVRTHSVTQDELSEGAIAYIVTHDDPLGDTAKVNYTVRTAILRSEPQPSVEFTRRLSSEIVSPGGTVTVVYQVRNTGNVALSSIRVQDSLGEFIGRVDSLAVDAAKTFISRITPSQDSVSMPELTYTVPALGNRVSTVSLEGIPVRVTPQTLSAALSVAQPDGRSNMAEVMLTLSCSGGADWTDITVTDDILGGLVADALRLDGDSVSKTISRSYTLRQETSFRWKVTARCESGETVELVTETITLSPEISQQEAIIHLRAEPALSEIGRAGIVNVRVYLENTGGMQAENLVLSEATLGVLRTFAVIPTGEATYRDFPVEIKEDAQLTFTAEYQNAAGDTRIVSSPSVSISIVPGAPKPDAAEQPPSDFSGSFRRMDGGSVYVVMLVCAGVVLAVLTVILLTKNRKARRERKMRLAAIRQRQKEEMGKTNRFTPLKRADKDRHPS